MVASQCLGYFFNLFEHCDVTFNVVFFRSHWIYKDQSIVRFLFLKKHDFDVLFKEGNTVKLTSSRHDEDCEKTPSKFCLSWSANLLVWRYTSRNFDTELETIIESFIEW